MDEPTRNYDRMRQGLTHRGLDPELTEMKDKGAEALALFNATEGQQDLEARRRLLRDILGASGKSWIIPPVRWEYGKHIFIEDSCLINSECLFLDGADVVIRKGTLVGPRCMFLTATHPVVPEDRLVFDPETGELERGYAINKPIEIGPNCWIGAGSIILPGVTIGEGTTIGAGSVVTKSMPSRVVAAGNPAQVIRQIESG